jgi:KipI family sensor histidine kinase inhibitor
MTELRIASAGDAALLVEWPAQIDPLVSSRAVALAQAVRAEYAAAVRDVVVGYCSATVYFDPLRVEADALESDVRRIARTLPDTAILEGGLIDVDVCYGGDLGPDLADVAAFAHVSEDDVVVLHSAMTYRVYVVGFIPGFPYMASVDPRLALPRRAIPRTRVPAGSVAIAAGQTGIYPSETPGGWHLIGRTRVRPYDGARAEPFLFKPGDRVRFHPVNRDEFERSA